MALLKSEMCNDIIWQLFLEKKMKYYGFISEIFACRRCYIEASTAILQNKCGLFF